MKQKELIHDLLNFQNEDFGNIRVVTINNEPWFVGKDIATALGYAKPENAISAHVYAEDKTSTLIQGSGSNYKSKVILINESGVYALVFGSKLESAKRFKHWVTKEVLPAIRRTGQYKPLTLDEQIQLVAKGYAELGSRVEKVAEDVRKLESDIPLYGAESDELSSHIKRKGTELMGGKKSEAYRDKAIRQSLYRDIYSQLKREFGLYDEEGKMKSYKALKRKHLEKAHSLIDEYEPPMYLVEQIRDANAQIRMV